MSEGHYEIEMHGQVVGEFSSEEAAEAAESLRDFDEGAVLRWVSSEEPEPQRSVKPKKPKKSVYGNRLESMTGGGRA